jgi:hypothetical protein
MPRRAAEAEAVDDRGIESLKVMEIERCMEENR